MINCIVSQMTLSKPRAMDSKKFDDTVAKLNSYKDVFLASDGSVDDLDPREGAVRLSYSADRDYSGTLTPEGDVAVAFVRDARREWRSFIVGNVSGSPTEVLRVEQVRDQVSHTSIMDKSSDGAVSERHVQGDMSLVYVDHGDVFFPSLHEVERSDTLTFTKSLDYPPDDSDYGPVIKGFHSDRARLDSLREQFLSLDGTDRDLDPRVGGVRLAGTRKSIQDGGFCGTLSPTGEMAVAFGWPDSRATSHSMINFADSNPAIVSYSDDPYEAGGGGYVTRSSLDVNGVVTHESAYANGLWVGVQGQHVFPDEPQKVEPQLVFRSHRA